jgi:hypothetical protein
MFKVGDRVKHDTHGTAGAVISNFGLLMVEYDTPPPGKAPQTRWALIVERGNLFLVTTWSINQRVTRTAHNASLQVPAGTLGTVDTVHGGVPTVRWDNGVQAGPYADTEISAVGSVTHQYKTGDRIRATCDHGEGIGLVHVAARPGDIGEYVGSYPTMTFPHKVRFGGETYYVNDEYIEPASAVHPAPRPVLACVRCSDTNAYAEPNLPDGRYACYTCRKYHSYSLTNK